MREDDGDWWYIDGYKTMSFLGTQTGVRFDKDPDKLATSANFDEVRPAAYDPRLFIDESASDGVWGSVIYPSQGLVLFSVPNTEVVSASMKAYNDWLAEFCSDDTQPPQGHRDGQRRRHRRRRRRVGPLCAISASPAR